jgi:hypothetical protein
VLRRPEEKCEVGLLGRTNSAQQLKHNYFTIKMKTYLSLPFVALIYFLSGAVDAQDLRYFLKPNVEGSRFVYFSYEPISKIYEIFSVRSNPIHLQAQAKPLRLELLLINSDGTKVQPYYSGVMDYLYRINRDDFLDDEASRVVTGFKCSLRMFDIVKAGYYSSPPNGVVFDPCGSRLTEPYSTASNSASLQQASDIDKLSFGSNLTSSMEATRQKNAGSKFVISESEIKKMLADTDALHFIASLNGQDYTAPPTDSSNNIGGQNKKVWIIKHDGFRELFWPSNWRIEGESSTKQGELTLQKANWISKNEYFAFNDVRKIVAGFRGCNTLQIIFNNESTGSVTDCNGSPMAGIVVDGTFHPISCIAGTSRRFRENQNKLFPVSESSVCIRFSRLDKYQSSTNFKEITILNDTESQKLLSQTD